MWLRPVYAISRRRRVDEDVRKLGLCVYERAAARKCVQPRLYVCVGVQVCACRRSAAGTSGTVQVMGKERER